MVIVATTRRSLSWCIQVDTQPTAFYGNRDIIYSKWGKITSIVHSWLPLLLMYVLWKGSEMTETDIVDSYEISWHVCINLLFIYLDYAFDIKLSYNIYLLESLIGCEEGAYGMFVNLNRVLRVPRYSMVDCT